MEIYIVYDPILCEFVMKTDQELKVIEVMILKNEIKYYSDLLSVLGFPIGSISDLLNSAPIFKVRVKGTDIFEYGGYCIDENGETIEMKTIRVV